MLLVTTRSQPYLKSLGRTGSPLLNVTLGLSLNVYVLSSPVLVQDSATMGFSSPVL